MNGLLQQQPQQASQEQQGQGQPQGKMGGQEVYKRIVEMALQFMYSEQGTEMIKQGLSLDGGDFIKNGGNVMAKMVMRILISASSSGKKLPPKMMFQIGMEIATAVAEMGEAMGVQGATKDSAEQVFFAGLTIAGREMPDNILTPEEKQEIVALINQVQQMGGSQGKQQQPQQPQQQPGAMQ